MLAKGHVDMVLGGELGEQSSKGIKRQTFSESYKKNKWYHKTWTPQANDNTANACPALTLQDLDPKGSQVSSFPQRFSPHGPTITDGALPRYIP